MLDTLSKIRKVIAVHVPGTAANVAQVKRAMEKRLRAEGYSRTHAVALVSEHFSKHLKEYP